MIIILFMILFTPSFGSLSESYDNDNNVRDRSLCEIKISMALSVLKTEIIHKMDTSDNKLNKLENKLGQLLKKNQDLEGVINDKFHNLEKNTIDKLENIKRKLDTMDNKIPEHLDINNKLDEIKKTILDSKDNSCCNWDTKNTNILQNYNSNLEQNIGKRIDELQKLETRILAEKYTYENHWGCKEVSLPIGYKYSTFYRIDDESLNHVTVKTNSSGLLYFEMHLAIKAERDAHVLLSSVPNPGANDTRTEIVFGNTRNKFSVIRLNPQRIDDATSASGNILSPTRFTSFYMKIDNGKLELYKGGELLVSLTNARFKEVKYFSLSAYRETSAKFLFDCPLHVQGYAIN